MAGFVSSLFSWYPGKTKVTFTHSEEPLLLPTKAGPKRAFPELLKGTTPPCSLNPFLFNGHLQTAWTSVKSPAPQIHYKRRIFEQNDPAFAGHFAVDFVVAPPPFGSNRDQDGLTEAKGLKEDPMGVGHTRLTPRTTYFTDEEFANIGSKDTKPMLITLHGLSGGSHEVYLRHVLAPLVAQVATKEQAASGDDHGLSGGEWEALVINSRGCAGSKITSSILYNARATWDIRQIVKWCRETWPNRPLFAIGYSLGANILINYLGEEGENCLLNAAAVVSNPWNLEVSNLALQRTYVGVEIYSKTMGRHMRDLVEMHREAILKNKSLSEKRILQVKYLYEFDREVQCATWGYPTENAYYRDASSADSVLAIRIPVMALHAVDDPIAVDEAVPYEEIRKTPYVVMVATSGGGHLGWFELGGGRWHAKPIVNYLNAMAQEIEFSKLEHPQPPRQGPHGGHKTPFMYDPMRRKAHRPDDPQ